MELTAPIPRERLEKFGLLLAEVKRRQAAKLHLELKKKYEGSLIEFFEAAWPSIDPAPYSPNWHLDAIAEHLQAVSYGEIKRLVINIPPRHAKTLLAGIAWNAWTWAQEPDPEYPLIGPQVKFLCLSYGLQLSLDTATTAKRLIQSPWYQSFWGDRVKLRSDQEAKAKFDTTAGGTRISSSFEGSLLGRGGDIRLIDDPHQTTEVESEDIRRGVLQTYDETLKSRVTDPKNTAEVTIMHRVHEDDLTNHILADGDAVHLMLPAEYEPDRKCITSLGWEDPRESEGELLWESRWGTEQLAPFKRVPYLWSGQYQQSPSPRGGGIIKSEWWQLWPSETYPSCEVIIASMDTAYTAKEENDASALTVWGLFRGTTKEVETDNAILVTPGLATNAYEAAHKRRREPGSPKLILLYAWQGRLELHDLVKTVGSICSMDGPEVLDLDGKPYPHFPVDRLVIEAKASGISVGQELKRLYGHQGQFGIELIDPTKWGDKVSRMYAIQHMFSDEMIYAPDRQFADMVIQNVSSFPKAAHDDLADAVSLGLRYMRLTGLAQRREEYSRAAKDDATFRGRERPLY